MPPIGHPPPESMPQVSKTGSFIVKIWIEEGEPSWRGSITHIATGEKRYVKELDEITRYFQHWISVLVESEAG